jgi:hypothetical protein
MVLKIWAKHFSPLSAVMKAFVWKTAAQLELFQLCKNSLTERRLAYYLKYVEEFDRLFREV